MFRAEIVWAYRRWSNSQKNLLPAHQNIYFYAKTENYKFNEMLEEYSPSTNVDQMLQKRIRDQHGKCVYAKDDNGDVVPSGCKKGVPPSDVWDIPYLNPKAMERTGYPTQKPILLLEKIVQLCTEEGDLVLDPFCGSGTTLVAAELLKRNSVGIDISEEAIGISRNRLNNPVKSESNLLKIGREAYRNADQESINYLNGLDVIPVHRNNGMDAILNVKDKDVFIPIRIQKNGESLIEAASALIKASRTKSPFLMILVATHRGQQVVSQPPRSDGLLIVDSTSMIIAKAVDDVIGKKMAVDK